MPDPYYATRLILTTRTPTNPPIFAARNPCSKTLVMLTLPREQAQCRGVQPWLSASEADPPSRSQRASAPVSPCIITRAADLRYLAGWCNISHVPLIRTLPAPKQVEILAATSGSTPRDPSGVILQRIGQHAVEAKKRHQLSVDCTCGYLFLRWRSLKPLGDISDIPQLTFSGPPSHPCPLLRCIGQRLR